MILMQQFWVFFWCCWLVMLCCHYFLLHCCGHLRSSAQLNFRSINLDRSVQRTDHTPMRFILCKALLSDHCIYLTVQNDSMLHYLFRLNFLSIWSIRDPFPSGNVKMYMICWGCGNSNSNHLAMDVFLNIKLRSAAWLKQTNKASELRQE